MGKEIEEGNKIAELLKPRYKVIADYPSSPFEVGTIQDDEFEISDMKLYPAIFKKLAWYEDRKEEDMPEYVKAIWRDEVIGVYKIHHWVIENKRPVGYLNPHTIIRAEKYNLPATAEEYEKSIKSV